MTTTEPTTEVPTFTATLSVGFRRGYSDYVHTKDEAIDVIQAYCNDVGLCVKIVDVLFIYSQRPGTPHGRDPGIDVCLINYPRFPSTPDQVRTHAEAIGLRLKEVLGQNRVSVVYPDFTKMVGEK
jgi:hypothetical protein